MAVIICMETYRSMKRAKNSKDGSPKTLTAFPPSQSKTSQAMQLSNGSVVGIPGPPINTSSLTTLDHTKLAMEHAGHAMLYLNHILSAPMPTLTLSHIFNPIKVNLEETLAHLYECVKNMESKEK